MNAPRVLVVDDDADIRSLVRRLLERAGCEVGEAAGGRAALRDFHEHGADVVVLDVTMPDLDGWATLERIRDLSDVPVLMLSARGSELEKVRGLNAGADDYVTKPFGRQELLSRVQALLRRSRPAVAVSERYEDGAVSIDFVRVAVTAAGREVALTPLEFRLLATFVRHPGQVLSRDQLLDLVWAGSPAGTEQVKLYVGYLRRKLGWEAADSPLETVRGFGYRYRSPAR